VSPEVAASVALSDAERARIEAGRGRALVGTGPGVAARLRALAVSLGVDELAVLTTAHDPEARRRSYTLLAEAWATEAKEPARQAA
jgi:alkanesulfonate monooxygenase SsuD/methylene tetrahydromethanopterin reductase-like flavin-dependent oxidoreductase (luciferase family)